MELKITGNITVMPYASKFTELCRFVPKFASFEKLKILLETIIAKPSLSDLAELFR